MVFVAERSNAPGCGPVPVRVSWVRFHHSKKYNNMLVDKRREEALKSLYYPKGIAEKRDRCYGKVIDNYRHTNTCIAVIPSDKTCVEFYRIEELAVQ
jgi:hypothetical protein